jgi:hypothetical protein
LISPLSVFSSQPRSQRRPVDRWFALRKVGLVASVFLAIWSAKLWTIGRYGSDLPYWDQWAKEGELFYAPWFEHHEFWHNLFVPHNEHRIAPTLALNLGLLKWGGDQWDARVQCVANAALHAALMAGLAWWALARLRRGWALAGCVLLVAIAAPPIAWENVLGGFQSQFYFLAIASILAIGGLLGAPAFSWRWFGGIVAAAVACVSMGSGMLVAAPIAAVALLRILSNRRSRNTPTGDPESATLLSAAATLVVALLIGGIGWWLRPQAPWHAAIHAHSLVQSLLYAARCLAWPLYGSPWLALVFWAPWAVLGALTVRRALRGDTPGHGETFVVAGGLWVLAQIAAVSYSRAGASELPAPRYGDICALGLAFNFLAFALLAARPGREDNRSPAATAAHPPSRKMAVAIVTAWLGVVAVSLIIATRTELRTDLPQKHSDSVAYERNVQAFVLTDDYETFSKEKLIPFPLPDWLARMIRNPTLRRLLPESVRSPVPVPGLADHAANAAPSLSHRATRTVTAGTMWQSALLTPDTGWWKIETAGDVGRPGASLDLVSLATHRVLASIQPTKPAGNSWRAAYVRAPKEPVVLIARVTPPAHWLAFSEPVEMSALGYRTWRLTLNAQWLGLLAAAGLLGFGVAVARGADARNV